MSTFDAGEEELLEAARSARMNAHAPYSRFAVGAALRMADGNIVTGANVENASYGLSLCAETVAIATASAAGGIADIRAIAVVGGSLDDPNGTAVVMPCGRCRQIINEAEQMGGTPIPILCAPPNGDSRARHSLEALLPKAFGPADLGFGATQVKD
jgi:cytidine deaminase